MIKNKIWNLILFLQVALAVIAAAVATLLGILFKIKNLGEVVAISSASAFVAGFFLSMQIYRGINKMISNPLKFEEFTNYKQND